MALGLPELPKIKLPNSPLNPLRDAIRDAREHITKAGNDIRSIAKELHGAIPGTASTVQGTTLRPELPTTEETTAELKRRLAKELYRAELDLSNKLRIAGKPCDCLEYKHSLGLQAAAEELIAQEPTNRVYSEIIQWLEDNRPKLTIEAIASRKYDEEYPMMASEFKAFRKRIMGTTELRAMRQPERQITLEEAKQLAAQQVAREVEHQWKEAK